MNNKIIIILAVLVGLAFMSNSNIELFGDYKSDCNKLPKAIKYALDKRKMKKVTDEPWEYYLPCGYTNCENNVLKLKNEKTGKKIFMIDGCDWLASKIGLWEILDEVFGESATKIMPKTFILYTDDDINEFKEHYAKKKLENKKTKFIVKNSYRQRQEGLKLKDNIKSIIENSKKKFNLVQDFLEDPYIISGRKINLRYYLLIICKDNKIEGWLYNDGFVYYTPKDFKKNSMDFNRCITTGYINRKIYENNPLTIKDFHKLIGKKSIKWNKKVDELFNKTIEALSKYICKNKKVKHLTKFQIFGPDIAPSDKLIPSLMEINKGPDLGFKDERDGNLKKQMIDDMFKVIEGSSQNTFRKIFSN